MTIQSLNRFKFLTVKFTFTVIGLNKMIKIDFNLKKGDNPYFLKILNEAFSFSFYTKAEISH